MAIPDHPYYAFKNAVIPSVIGRRNVVLCYRSFSIRMADQIRLISDADLARKMSAQLVLLYRRISSNAQMNFSCRAADLKTNFLIMHGNRMIRTVEREPLAL